MMRWLALLLAGCALSGQAAAEVLLSEAEVAAALSHGPWPPEMAPDPGNRVSGDPGAIALGAALFFDPILSPDGAFSCATCHDPAQGFADGAARATGRVPLDRNTPSVWNLRWNRWFGWGGATDNLWAQSLRPIVDPAEMGHDPASLQAALRDSPLARPYGALFGPLDGPDPQQTLVNVGKALAAWQETLVTGQTAFDRFRDALARGDMAAAGHYPAAAQRGLILFLGRGNCGVCHSGPGFSNGEFHDAGVPYFVTPTRVDPGRQGGLKSLLQSPYTLDGPHSDDPERTGGWAVRTVRPQHSDFGTFRVPGLRNVTRTAPYMHDGSLPDLAAVIRHYNDIDLERMHADGEAILAPLNLTEAEIADLVRFLETLDDAS